MTQISKYPITDNVYQRILDIFFKSLVEIKTGDEAKQFIKDFLSPTEQIMLSKRLAIAFLLEKKYEFRQISRILRVSLTTVAKVSMMRKYGGEGYQKIINKILREEQVKDFLEKVGESLTEVVSKGKGSATWRYLNQELKTKRQSRPF